MPASIAWLRSTSSALPPGSAADEAARRAAAIPDVGGADGVVDQRPAPLEAQQGGDGEAVHVVEVGEIAAAEDRPAAAAPGLGHDERPAAGHPDVLDDELDVGAEAALDRRA